MKGMMDVSCAKCRRRIGWFGDFTDQPACPRCGHRPTTEALDALQAQMDRARADAMEDMECPECDGEGRIERSPGVWRLCPACVRRQVAREAARHDDR